MYSTCCSVVSSTARPSRRCQIAAGERSKPQHSLFLWFRDQPRQPTEHDPPQPPPVVRRQPQRQGPPGLHAAHEVLSPPAGSLLLPLGCRYSISCFAVSIFLLACDNCDMSETY